MKIKNQIGHQGDTQWYSIDEIPATAKKIRKNFIAASERSGSFHALFGNYEMYSYEGNFVLDVKEDCILNHSHESQLRSKKKLDTAEIIEKKDHRHSVITKGLYIVGIQNRFDPLENHRKRVID